MSNNKKDSMSIKHRISNFFIYEHITNHIRATCKKLVETKGRRYHKDMIVEYQSSSSNKKCDLRTAKGEKCRDVSIL